MTQIVTKLMTLTLLACIVFSKFVSIIDELLVKVKLLI